MINKETCKICNCSLEKVFDKKILNKYNIDYYMCNNCGFIQTEKPYWLDEVYKDDAISALDTGIVLRNLHNQIITKNLIDTVLIKSKGMFLDYGGGDGLFTRLMRDIGYNFYLQDKHSVNKYARFFDLTDLKEAKRNFNLITLFEVFEHVENPLELLNKLFTMSDTILFSTEIYKENEDLKSWWYLLPESGQHISFVNSKTLKQIADILDAKIYSNDYNMHIISKNKSLNLSKSLFSTKEAFNYTYCLEDHEYIKKLLNE